jgi:hypothetical protein
MDYTPQMRLVERIRHLARVAQSFFERERSSPQPFGERLAFELLENEEVDAVLASNVVEGADVRLGEARDGAGLLLESSPPLGIARKLRGQHLDGNGAREPRVPRTVHLAHATCTDGVENFKGTESLAGG